MLFRSPNDEEQDKENKKTKDTQLTISPPEGKQLYGIILYTNEIEHSMLINNRTTFGDTIFDDIFGSRQKRVKLKGKRTQNWNGRDRNWRVKRMNTSPNI